MIDYEGKEVRVGDRIELHPACDLWMRGARFGTVVAVDGSCVTVDMDHASVQRGLYVLSKDLRVLR